MLAHQARLCKDCGVKINGHTRLVAVLGDPIEHTASPAMHQSAFHALKMNWCYLALKVHPNHLPSALSGLAQSGFVGVNLTVPHKILAFKLLDKASPESLLFGASNTLVFSQNGSSPHFYGFNTDGYGLLQSLKEDLNFRPARRTVAVVGCGGAGQSAAIQMAQAGAKHLILLNRTVSKAQAIVRRLRQLNFKTTCSLSPAPCDLLIQATSLGLRRDDPLPLERHTLVQLQPQAVYDMIYRPPQTPFLRMASKRGCRTANGLGMLLHQGALSFKIWTGKTPPIEVMRKALKKEVHG